METGLVQGSTVVNKEGVKRQTVPKNAFPQVLDTQVSKRSSGSGRATSSVSGDSQIHVERNVAPSPVILGTISRSQPTVSNLLIAHPVYGKNCWPIIHSEINRGKQFTRIQADTAVYLNPETLEIRWGTESEELKRPAPGKGNDPVASKDGRTAEPLPSNLVKAVAPYLGKPYKEINCYGLVVRGLKKLGIQYQGSGGLQEKLIKMAMQRGRPENAYLNGEGIVQASGHAVYSKSISGIRDSEAEAAKTFEEVEPLLDRGFILSFSTPTRGHTGIVSRRDDLWTYINSGNMDNEVGLRGIPKGVGEESLSAEVKNWFRLAQRRNEPLLITLGQLNSQKLAFFQKNRSGVTEKV